ncbi:hypothetical protein K4L44_08970 [Halosquirtibacter laminarini]|uniref:Uncharacterized protein n=1 Tax=Halosquirtibacter laminarini TaxID=3374600 RepID=A0AC61NEZ3_9BACT|nr:hypothetical protein K4L44_08970 [Prolixibacteraceae bacterium]
MKKNIFLLILFSATLLCYGQDDKIYTPTNWNTKVSFNTSSLKGYGMHIGLEYPFRKVEVTKIKKSSKQKQILKNNYITGNVSFYNQNNYHTNLYMTVGYTKRRIGHKGFFQEFSIETGYSRTFLAGKTYSVDNTGVITEVSNPGYNYFLLNIGGGLGYDFSKRKPSIPLSVFVELNVNLLTPYSSKSMYKPTLEIGVIYRLPILSTDTRTIKKTK